MRKIKIFTSKNDIEAIDGGFFLGGGCLSMIGWKCSDFLRVRRRNLRLVDDSLR